MADFPSQTSDTKQPLLDPSAQKATRAPVDAMPSDSSWSSLEVPIWIDNPNGCVSENQPLTIGVHLSRGTVFSPCHALLRTSREETSIRAQCAPLAYWSDGSIRWLLVDSIAPAVPPGRSNWYVKLSPGEQPEMDSKSIAFTATSPNSYEVTSGQHFYWLDGNGSTPLQFGTRESGEKLSLVFKLTDSRGQAHAATFHSVVVEAEGPLRSRFLLQGTLPAAIGLECRLRVTVFAERGLTRLQVTLHNPRRAHHEGGLWDLGDAGSVHFQSWTMKLSFGSAANAKNDASVAWKREPGDESTGLGQDVFIYQDSSGGENWRGPVHMNRSGRVPCQFRGYRTKYGPATSTGLRANPTVAARHGKLAVAAAVSEFWQQFPLSIQADATGVEVDLFPSEWSDQFELQGGEQKTHAVWLAFDPELSEDPKALEQAVTSLSTVAHTAVRAACSPDWYASTNAMSFLSPTDKSGMQPVCRDILQTALAGEQSLFARRETIDEYGWRNYGDLWADHEQAHFQGSGLVISHYNNQFDLIAGGLRQLMLSGDCAWWSLVAPLARHVIDIDIYHTTQDRAAYNGGLFWFTDHYCTAATSTHRTYSRHNVPQSAGAQKHADYGGGPGSEHNFATGLLYYYWMTGEPDAAEAVRLLADWVIAMDDGRENFLGLLDDGPTGLASMCTSIDYQGPGRGAANSMQVLLDAWLLTRDEQYLAKSEAILRRVIHPADDIAGLNLLDAEHRWSYTMLLAAIVRYLQVVDEMGREDETRAYARESLLAYARWMSEHERPYLDHPEQLQFPTEAWAAQDLRKANVLRLAAQFETNSAEAEKMRRKGTELADRAWSDLEAFPTRHNARTVAIVMTEGPIDGYLRSNRESSLPNPASTNYNFGMPMAFVPQKMRIRQASRKPLGILQLLLAALRPSAWLRLASIYHRQRARKPE